MRLAAALAALAALLAPPARADRASSLPELGEREPALKFDTYVINLDSRRDRCMCMARQLADAPQAVYRQAAVGAHECRHLRDDWASLRTGRNHTAEKSLFCSNYQIWRRAAPSDADFVIVMEDDAALAPHFWDTVMRFLLDCPNFDYVAVDSWAGFINRSAHRALRAPRGLRPGRVCPRGGGGRVLFRPEPQRGLVFWGAQVQIVRRPFLNTLLHRAKRYGMGSQDNWWSLHLNDRRAFSWQPGISPQVGKDINGLIIPADPLFEDRARFASFDTPDCPRSMLKSDIHPKQSLMQSSAQRLRCPS
mmetsp:Transcript_88317/g.274514  ORF Transcript_88317/g.274514 Transcript_88317/m.274514 type:complete len:306 (-) Transcript_88317:65-982(-)